MSVTMLTYRGDGAYRPSLPARDLDRADIELNAQQRGIPVDDVVAEAVGSGLYLAVEAPDEPEVSAGNDGAAEPSATVDPVTDPRTTRAELVAIAAALELVVEPKATKALIAGRIRAERQRLADAATAAGSGEGTGGDSTPGDDSEASASDEPGPPPEESPEA